jgi:hypothetical protein
MAMREREMHKPVTGGADAPGGSVGIYATEKRRAHSKNATLCFFLKKMGANQSWRVDALVR